MNVAPYTDTPFKNYLPPQHPSEHPNGVHHYGPRQNLPFANPPTSPQRKRRRNSSDAGSQIAGPSNHYDPYISMDEREADNAGRRISKAPNHYESSMELMTALAACFKPGGQSVFSGTYTTPNDPPISDKQRIQLVSNDIWRATGYRFTVKDHPPVKDGHKTRLWCSQDAQRRGKPNSKIRLAASGEVMAKARFPCRSRLLISSRDAKLPGHRMITIRMYHHVAHEPYYDPSVPAPVLQAIWGAPHWPMAPPPAKSANPVGPCRPQATPSGPRMPVDLIGMDPNMSPMVNDWRSDSEKEDSDAEGDQDSGTEDDFNISLPPSSIHSTPNLVGLPSANISALGLAPLPIPQPTSAPPPSPRVDPDLIARSERFQSAMRQHIRNIRDFCDGLEYQVQFNDFRMLDELEARGGPFLQYVRDCLVREGRLMDPTGMRTHYPTPGGSSGDL
ncbi:hypothetical protein K435DRAFT_971589 [Dendrothele bispora CBS 962.96]|uniref:Uncharacterized protein n=1 Tax=Dendrothele bispora (strain CBS 962.96) TaxID=1314807 RepID=A0A4S8L5P7_DENBC|nr:hypothetical protein K435DRAFT_971589 [Dendrothele bispora CBS 962.96]